MDMCNQSVADVWRTLAAQTHRRFIKTHTPLDGLPHDPSVTYLCVARDPRDVALSMDNHWQNMDFEAFFAAREAAAAKDGRVIEPLAPPPLRPDSPYERFWSWVDDDTPFNRSGSSLLLTLRHLATFWDAPDALDVVMLHFDDLRTDLGGQMRALAERLGIAVPEERWPELVRAATFDQMRMRADQVAPNARMGTWVDNARFFNRGTSGQWRELLDAADLERYRARAEAIGPADLVTWVHRDGPQTAPR
jgi:hypothetical protein